MKPVHKALLVFVGAMVLMGAMFLGASQVGRNSADLQTVCDKVNAVRTYIDKLVQRTTANASQPPAKVADPAVQTLIDEGRKANEEFKQFAHEQSEKARCEI